MKEALIVRDSFSIPFRNGAIWCEELDGLGDHGDLVREKFLRDIKTIARPSSPARIALHLYGTDVDEALLALFAQQLAGAGTAVARVAVVGLSKRDRRLAKMAFGNVKPGFAQEYFDDLEKAKEWLIPG